MITSLAFDLIDTLIAVSAKPRHFLSSYVPEHSQSVIDEVLTTICIQEPGINEEKFLELACLDLALPIRPQELRTVWYHTFDLAALRHEVVELLTVCQETQVRTCIVSNCYPPVRSLIKAVGLDRLVDEIVLSYEIGVWKPDVEIFDHATRSLGVTANQICMIGDRYQTDFAGALGAGMWALLIRPLSARHPEKRSRPMTCRLPSIGDLLESALIQPRLFTREVARMAEEQAGFPRNMAATR